MLQAMQREEKVARYGTRHGTRIGLAVALALCAISAVLAVAMRAPTSNGSAARCIHAHAGFVDVRESCVEPVKIAEHGADVVVYPGASVERVRDAIRVRRGKASFAVHKRTDGSTLRVHVSHGVIEVTGTRFTVEQGEGRGRVELAEGTIIFHDDNGDDVTLSAGDVLVWPREIVEPVVEPPASPALTAVPSPRPAASRERPPQRTERAKTVSPPVAAIAEGEDAEEDDDEEDDVDELQPPTRVLSMEEVLKRIAELRQKKRLRDAVTLLVSQSQRGDITSAQMARLSWEIGLFIQETGDKAAACTHWRNHARKYPDDSAQIERVRALVDACAE